MNSPLVFTVTEPGQRLDVFVTASLGEGHSRAEAQRLIKDGYVTRDGGVLEANPARKVRLDEVYTVDMPAAVASQLVPEDIPLNVVFEDAYLLVINKPAGLTVHPAPGNETGTLVQALLHHCMIPEAGLCPEQSPTTSLSGINGELRPGIVHRIDKDTTGLMVVAKTDAAHRHLARQFLHHSIHRVYVALCRGVPVPAVGKIEGNIGRHAVHRLKRAVVPEGGKHATTHYLVTERFGEAASLVRLQLETGRTHQIRVHMAHKGHPLLNDPLYGNGNPLKGLQGITLPTLPGQALHAAELGFVHPISGVEMRFEAGLPAEMQALVSALRLALNAED